MNNNYTRAIAADILIEIIAIKKISTTVYVNKRQCARINTRIACLVPTVNRIRDSTAPHSYSEITLNDILIYLRAIKEFLFKFNVEYIKKAWKNFYDDSKSFSVFNQGICDKLGSHRLQFDLFANEKQNRQEDAMDRDFDRQEIRAKLEPPPKIVKEEVLIVKNEDPPKEEFIIDNSELIALIKQLRAKKKVFDWIKFPPLRPIDMDLLDLNNSHFKIGTVDNSSTETYLYLLLYLGDGKYGKIIHGKYKAEEVAIKFIDSEKNLLDICTDFKIDTMFCQLLQCDGILNIIGVQLDFAPRVMVMELAHCSIYAAIHEETTPVGKLKEPFLSSYAIKISIIKDIASTMLHLHTLGLVYRNISSKSFLLSRNMKPKLIDLQLHSDSVESSPFVAYAAPEVILGGSYSKGSDVYAFAILMNEILSCQRPYSQLNGLQIMQAVTNANPEYHTRPPVFSIPFEIEISKEMEIIIYNLRHLLEVMWADNLSRRPNFQYILKLLQEVEVDNRIVAATVEPQVDSVNNTDSSHETKSEPLNQEESQLQLPVNENIDSVVPFTDTVESPNELSPEIVVATTADDLDDLMSENQENTDILQELSGETTGSHLPLVLRKATALAVSVPWQVLVQRLMSTHSDLRIRQVVSEEAVGETFTKLQEAVVKTPTLRNDLRNAGLCKVMVEIMAMAETNQESGVGIALLERGLWFAAVLGTHNRHNREALVSCGIFIVIDNVWKTFRGSSTPLLIAALLSLETLLIDNSSAAQFAEKFNGCQFLFDTLQLFGLQQENICDHCFASITHLVKHFPSSKKVLEELGVCRCIVAVLIKFSEEDDFYVTDACMTSIIQLCSDNAVNTSKSKKHSHAREEPASIHSITEKLGDLGAAELVFKTLLKAKEIHKLSVMETSLAAMASLARGNDDNQLRLIRAGAVQVMMELLSVRGHVAVESVYLCELVLDVLSLLITKDEALALLSGRAVTKLQIEQNFSDLFRNVIANIQEHATASAVVADSGLLLLKILINHKKDRWAKVGSLGGCKLLSDIIRVWLGSAKKESRDDSSIPVGLYDRCLVMAKGFGSSSTANATLLQERKTDAVIVEAFHLLGFHSEQTLQVGMEVVSMLVSHYKTQPVSLSNPTLQIQMCGVVLELLSKFGKLRMEMAVQVLQPMNLLSSQSSNKPTLCTAAAVRTLVDVIRIHLLSDRFKLHLHESRVPPQIMKNVISLAEVGLSCIANLAENNDDIANLSASGICDMIGEILREFGKLKDGVAVEGLRCIANLAVSNQSRFAHIDICATIFDIIHFYYFTSKSENGDLSMYVCRSVYNLSLHNTFNKERCIELNIPAELRSILRSRALSDSVRKEIKEAINFLHY